MIPSLVARRSSLVLTSSLLASVGAAQVSVLANHHVGGRPLDLALAEDETFAVVRTSTAEYMLDLSAPGMPIVLTTAHVSDPLTATAEIVKLVGILEDRAVVGGYNNPAFGVTTPNIKAFQSNPPLELVQPPSISQPGTVDVVMGYAPVTADPIAAMRFDEAHFTHISIRDLKTGVASSGFIPATPTQLCGTPFPRTDGLANTLGLTSNRIIAISNQDVPQSPGGGGLERGVVTIAHVGAQPSGWPKYHGFTPCGQPLANGFELVHDVGTSPNGVIGVVSGTQVIGVYSLRTGLEIEVFQGPNLPTPNFLAPQRMVTGDSVAVTNKRAVVIGNDHVHTGVTPVFVGSDPFGFIVTILDVSTAPPLANVTFNAAMLGIPTPSRVHDVVTTPNGSRAVATTRAGTLVIDLTQPVSTSPLSPVPVLVGSTDPLEFSDTLLVSDSVECTDSHAVVIGRSPTLQGQVEVIQLLSPTYASTVIPIGPVGQFVPTDVVISSDGTKAIIRSTRHTPIVAQQPGRLTVVDLGSAAVLLDVDVSPIGTASLGASVGLDHVLAGSGRAIAIGQEGSGTRIQVLQL